MLNSKTKVCINLSLGIVMLFCILFFWSMGHSKASEQIELGRIEITVGVGDSLWSIAKKIAPNHDTDEVIWYLMRLNGRENKVVRPGEQLIFDYAAIN